MSTSGATGGACFDIAIEAFRALPFPDGAIIAALHWNEASSDADNQVLASGFPGAGLESVFAGSAVNVQFMVKDSKKYAASDRTRWQFASRSSHRSVGFEVSAITPRSSTARTFIHIDYLSVSESTTV